MAQTIGSLDLNAFSDLYNDSTQYFWFESNASATYGAGVHITLSPDTSFISNPTGQNILMNTNGISIRNGLLPMMVLDNDSLDFNTVNTTAGTYTNVASFGASSTIGVTDGTKSYMTLDSHSLQMIDKEGDTYLYISDLRNDAGIATLSESFVGDGSQIYFNVTLDISSVVSVTINGTSTTAYSLSSITRTEIKFNVAPADGAEIIVTYTTTNQNAKSFTLGIRGTGDVGACSIAMGAGTVASEGYSMACGHNATASGKSSYAEGDSTVASGDYSHAGGDSTVASGRYSYAEGRTTYATGNLSHAEGEITIAAGLHSHAENHYAKAYGNSSHAQGYDTYAMGNFSTACGNTTRAYGRSTFVIGEYNSYPTPTPAADTRGDHAFIIGNGTSATPDSNALTVDWDGNITVNDHSSSIGTVLSHVPADVSCATGKYYQIAYLELDPGIWMVDYVGGFPNTNTTGIRDTFVTSATSGYNNVTTAPASIGKITRDRRKGEAHIIYCTASFPINVTSTTTYRVIGYQNSGQTNAVSGRMYAVRIK